MPRTAVLPNRGLARERLSPEQVLAQRLFPSRVRLPRDLATVDAQRVPTRQLPRLRCHELTHEA